MDEIQISMLDDYDSDAFAQAVDIYIQAFPANEVRPVDATVSLLAGDDRYKMFVALMDKSIVGVMLLYFSKHFVLIDYMAVRKNMRGKGIGGEMVWYLKSNVLSAEIPVMLMEIQQEMEPDIRKKTDRIRFWKRHGAFLITDKYVMPGYGSGGSEVMNLMGITHPDVSAWNDRKQTVDEMISEIHDGVYGISGLDSETVTSERSKVVDGDL